MNLTVNGTIETDFQSINKLIDINNALSKANFLEECVIDMTRVTWFNAALCSFYKAFLRQCILDKGLRIIFKLNQSIQDIFYRNGFINGEVQDIHDTIFPVKDFRISAIETFLKEMKHDFVQNSNKFPFPAEFTRDIQKSLGEIFSNSQIHSGADWVYTSGQFFPAKEKITFCITDTGIGIVNKVKQKFDNIESKSAIDWAFGEGNTTKIGFGGLGLFELKKKVEERGGELIIVSNDTYYNVLTGVAKKFQFDFKGTSAIVTLSCKG